MDLHIEGNFFSWSGDNNTKERNIASERLFDLILRVYWREIFLIMDQIIPRVNILKKNMMLILMMTVKTTSVLGDASVLITGKLMEMIEGDVESTVNKGKTVISEKGIDMNSEENINKHSEKEVQNNSGEKSKNF